MADIRAALKRFFIEELHWPEQDAEIFAEIFIRRYWRENA